MSKKDTKVENEGVEANSPTPKVQSDKEKFNETLKELGSKIKENESTESKEPEPIEASQPPAVEEETPESTDLLDLETNTDIRLEDSEDNEDVSVEQPKKIFGQSYQPTVRFLVNGKLVDANGQPV